MLAAAKIDNLESTDAINCIVRNLSRILDLRIASIDLETRTIYILYNRIQALERAKRELFSIGYPIQNIIIKSNDSNMTSEARTLVK